MSKEYKLTYGHRTRNKNGVNFNYEHYLKVRKARKEQGIAVDVWEGMFPTRTERNGLYCAPIDKWLEPHGNFPDHPMIGKRFTSMKNKLKEVVCDSVQVHFMDGGYYYQALMVDENRSHAAVWFENINCENPIVCDAVRQFFHDYKPLD